MFLRDPKRLIATIIAGVVGVIVLIDFVNSSSPLALFARTLVEWGALLASLALLLGIVNVIVNHIGRIIGRQPDWGYSLVLLAALIVVVIAGVAYPLRTPDGGFTVPQNLVEEPIRELFAVVYQPLAASFLALLAFFSLSAALRAVRRRSRDALVIVGVAMLVLVISALPQLDAIPLIGESVRWFNDFIVLAGARGLLLGAALGALVAGVRVLLGFDQPFLDR